MKKIIAVFVSGALIAPALAEIRATVGTPLGQWSFTSSTQGTLEEQADGSLRWYGEVQRPDLGCDIEWDYLVDGDPYITGVANFTNVLGVTANFSFDISANSDVTIAAPTVFGASTITVLDVNGNGAQMDALAGDSIYRAFIVATTQETLFDAPYGLSAGPFGVDFDGLTWGPQPAIGGIVLGDIFGIDHDFSLTSGDQATLNSSFFIVPEPATVVLLLVGGLVATRRR